MNMTDKEIERRTKIALMLTNEGQERLKRRIIERVRAEEESQETKRRIFGRLKEAFSFLSIVRSRKVQIAVGMVVVISLIIGVFSIERKTKYEALANDVVVASKALQEQKENTYDTFVEANQVRNEAIQQPEFKIKSEKTKAFISKWNQTEEEVRQLRKDFDVAVKRGDFFFAYSEKKVLEIRDEDIRTKILAAIKERKSNYAAAAVKTDKAIDTLEEAISKGKDIVAALKIVSVLKQVDEVLAQFDTLHSQAIEKLPEIDALIKEGMNLLDTELEFR